MKKYLQSWAVLMCMVPGLVHAASVKLTWQDNSLTESGFVIYSKEGMSGNFTKLAEVNANVTTYTDATVPASGMRCYEVKAQRNAEMSVPTNTECFTTTAPPIEAPSNLSIIKVTVEVIQPSLPSTTVEE